MLTCGLTGCAAVRNWEGGTAGNLVIIAERSIDVELTLRVVDATTQRPIADVGVFNGYIQRQHADNLANEYQLSVSNSDGLVHVSYSPINGVVEITFIKTGYEIAFARAVEPFEGDGKVDLKTIYLTPVPSMVPANHE